ncbi:MAG: hypothetical protein QOE11_2746 [Solirubrobacteraceae bacterium]|nr:hypothetical protein [Solirubrobacteraceae bacterium]
MIAAFPRVAYWLSWPTRLGPRGLLAYIALKTAGGFALRAGVPRLKRAADEYAAAREELRQRVGREPTERELLEHLGLAN